VILIMFVIFTDQWS